MQSKKFIFKLLIFAVLNLAVMASLLSFFSGRNRDIHLKNWETESNLLVTGANEHYDLAILGTSRGRVFSRDEPFELSTLRDLVLNRFPSQRIISYLQMIAVYDWKDIGKYGAPGLDLLTLEAIDPVKLEEARKHYLGLYDYKKFNYYSKFTTDIIRIVKKHKSKITYVMLSFLMQNFPGAGQVDETLRGICQKEKVGYYNLADRMHDRHFFYDHMHFNSNGVVHFTETYMRWILKQVPPESCIELNGKAQTATMDFSCKNIKNKSID